MASANNSPSRTPPRRLDHGFLALLTSIAAAGDMDMRLSNYLGRNGILNPFGDKLEKVTRMFTDDKDIIRPWLENGSLLKEKLKAYPDIYHGLWPEDVWVEEEFAASFRARELLDYGSSDSDEPSDSAKRKRVEEPGEKTLEGREDESVFPFEEDGDSLGSSRETTKRRRIQSPETIVIGSTDEEDNATVPQEVVVVSSGSEGDNTPPSSLSPRSIVQADAPLAHNPGYMRNPTPPGMTPQHSPHPDLAARTDLLELPNEEWVSPPDKNDLRPLSPAPAESPQPESSRSHEPGQKGPPEPSLAPPPQVGSAATARKSLPLPFPPSAFPPSAFPLPRTRRLPRFSPDIQPDYSVPIPAVEEIDPDEQDRAVTRLDRFGWEWTAATERDGFRRPPLGGLLEHALNYLREEDGDRRKTWQAEFKDTEEWLDYLGTGGLESLEETNGKCNLQVYNMFLDAKRKVKAIKAFEREKYGVVKPGDGIKAVEDVPLPKRGKRPVVKDARGVRLCLSEEVKDEGKRSVLAVKPERVHTQFPPSDADGAEFLSHLNTSERAFWAAAPDTESSRDYLFRLETAAYEACSAPGGPLQGYKTEDGYGSLVLPPRDALPTAPGVLTGLGGRLHASAVERGARRAALQGALRCFANTEQILAGTEWSRVVPGVEEGVLEAVRRDLDRNHQFGSGTVDWRTAPVARDGTETMGYTVAWRYHRTLMGELAEHTRKEVDRINCETRGWVTLPRNLGNGGPFVWRGVDPDVQEMQDLLKECEGVFKGIVRMPRMCAEPVLDGVKRWARGAAHGEFGMSGVRGRPENMRLGRDDLETTGQLVRNVGREELGWLRFLMGRYLNKSMLETEGGYKPKLYSIFTARLEKMMDDRSDRALLLDAERWATIEELLEIMNRGCDESGRRYQFSPFEARHFLERAQEQGLCRYKEDIMVYGKVARSNRNIEPIDRIVVPVRSADGELDPGLGMVPSYPNDIVSFHDLDTSNPDTRLQTIKFFHNLGLRLGLTIYRLRQREKKWHKATPLDISLFRPVLDTFNRSYRDICEKQGYIMYPESDEPALSLSLNQFVKHVNPSDWEPIHNAVSKLNFSDWNPDLEEAAIEAVALRFIRQRIIKENHENLSMLGRGRQTEYTKPDGNKGFIWSRDHNWDWASEPVRGRAKKYFSLDRWPLELQSDEMAGRIRSDEFVDEKLVFDPVAEDPIPQRCFREKLRRYGDSERVRHRPGPALYPIGDTVLQRRVVRQTLEDSVARATGDYSSEGPRTWTETLARMLPSRQARVSDDIEMAETYLPRVDPELVPESCEAPVDALVDSPREVEDGNSAERSVLSFAEDEDDEDVHMDEPS